ncbi:hypothetical protein NE624_18370, partial [Alistipes onderdonkii]|nr:hypothetical protein [Alistipes onderdonkii]
KQRCVHSAARPRKGIGSINQAEGRVSDKQHCPQVVMPRRRNAVSERFALAEMPFQRPDELNA